MNSSLKTHSLKNKILTKNIKNSTQFMEQLYMCMKMGNNNQADLLFWILKLNLQPWEMIASWIWSSKEG